MNSLLKQIEACRVCEPQLAHGCRPVIAASPLSRIVIIGQAPGRIVHESGIPWDDKSGDRLREWLGIDKATFYDPDQVALIPMGFCYPGKGRSGDLPPRKECAPLWHPSLLDAMKEVKLTLLVGSYAQKYYLQGSMRPTLTETVRYFQEYLPAFLPLPHPSPRNNIWIKKNPWFTEDLLPELKRIVEGLI